MSKLDWFHEYYGRSWLKDRPGFQCLEATAHYRNDVRGISVCYRLIARNVSSDDKSQVFILCAELTFNIIFRPAAYLVEVFDGSILQVTFNTKNT